MHEIDIPPCPPDSCDGLIGPDKAREFAEAIGRVKDRLDGRTLWYISSTAKGGGVAEILSTVLCYLAGAGLPTRWLVIEGDAPFFEVTKRVHHRLHGSPGDGTPLDHYSRAVYESALSENLEPLLAVVGHGDPVVLNDPQTIGLAPALSGVGAGVIWSCHVGRDEANDWTRQAWAFLHDYLPGTSAQVFSRPEYAWEGLDPAGVRVIPPCLDPFSAKNQELDADSVCSILRVTGLLADGASTGATRFIRRDGSEGTAQRPATWHQERPLEPGEAIVTQVSRWDPLKDHVGVLQAFVEFVPARSGAHLVLAGPALESVDDDPEDQKTYEALIEAWEALPEPDRARVHVGALPMDDLQENAAMVNALQRYSDVVAQKSLAEGFGLTVAEAMFKRRPVVSSRVGGIQDQIEHEHSGFLVDDPTDNRGFGEAVERVLSDPGLAERIGQAAAARVVGEYLPPLHLTRYLHLIDEVL